MGESPILRKIPFEAIAFSNLMSIVNLLRRAEGPITVPALAPCNRRHEGFFDISPYSGQPPSVAVHGLCGGCKGGWAGGVDE